MLTMLSGWFLGFAFAAAPQTVNKTKTEKAILVKIDITQACAGLDCPPPPFPVPFDAHLCFQIEDNYYVGVYRPWGIPSNPPGKKLQTLKGQTVEIVVGQEHIQMKAPFHLKLRRIPNHQGSCTPSDSSPVASNATAPRLLGSALPSMTLSS